MLVDINKTYIRVFYLIQTCLNLRYDHLSFFFKNLKCCNLNFPSLNCHVTHNFPSQENFACLQGLHFMGCNPFKTKTCSRAVVCRQLYQNNKF